MDKQEFVFRTIDVSEAEEAADIEQICFPPNEACKRENMILRVQKIPGQFLVAYDPAKGQIAGTIHAVASDEDVFLDEFFTDPERYRTEGRNLFLVSVAVRPEYRGRHLAHDMMARYVEESRQQGRERLILTCHAEKVGFYESMGYEDKGISGSVWGGEVWHEMVYDLRKEK